MSATVNIARFLPEACRKHPFKKAVICLDRMFPDRFSYVHQTFSEVNEYANRYAHGLKAMGFTQGMKVLLAVRPGLDFVPLTFALFKIGAVPVMIDPGMGKENLLKCIELVAPEALIGVAQAHIAKLLKPKAFKSVRLSIVVGPKLILPGTALKDVFSNNREEFPIANTRAHDMAAIVYTTGSTGTPKGVVYFHEQMEGQVRLIREQFQIPENAVDLPVFPLFALFAVAWGITAVIPHMDPTKPALADEKILIRQIMDQGVSFSIGSPALWDRLGAYCEKNEITLPCLKQILMVGAPVRPYILKRFQKILPNGETYTPYGATEALPVAVISGSEVLKSTAELSEQGKGTCIGRAFPDITLQVIRISEEAIPKWDESLLCAKNEVGEIVVKGPIVTHEYFKLPEATALAKIMDGDTVWHRMGDLGYLDESGRLWFCGRKAHRVESQNQRFLSVCCEAIFNQHPKVFRSALVGVKKHGSEKIPVMIVEPKPNQMPQTTSEAEKFVDELLKLAGQYEHTKAIKTVLFHPSFPVDIRHNAKIFREKLSIWAQKELGDCGCEH